MTAHNLPQSKTTAKPMAAVPEWSFRREFDVEIRNTNNENGFYCVRAIVERIASLVLARNACVRAA